MTATSKRAEERRNYQKLERRLVLLNWLLGKFGFRENKDLLEFTALADEGFDGEGRAYVTNLLRNRGSKCTIDPGDLERYDANIRRHLDHINRLRSQPVVLKYFQHLALLFSEIFLDAWAHRRASLRAELNAFVRSRNIDKTDGEPDDEEFSPSELNKLAFWMATGSGKTLLFHLNYLQFRHYAKEAGQTIDNILLLTPNENLTLQHLEEMAASDIPCARFSPHSSGLALARADAVRVLEITKLVTEKKGGGESVPVEAFEGFNLIFVDEGHKGTGSEAQTWRERRQALVAQGFTFEYSATFGQALDAAKTDAVTGEYAKAILFDYSYKYFYGDGFGKDFHILNLKDYEDEDSVYMLLLANLLSFYEQRAFYHANANVLRDYGVEPPLWLQICSRVSATNAEVMTVLKFLARFTLNERDWAVKRIAQVLEGKSGIELDGERTDLFAGRLPWLRAGSKSKDAAKVYHDILSRVFESANPGELEIKTLKSAKGEIALRVSGATTDFGLLNIGNVSGFKKVLDAEAPELVLGEDAVAQPLFHSVKQPTSKVNILIGAKMFMEGWSSWRVSNIGLLNVGVSEGSEIIQLFGRGVRLKGRGFSLKRSSALPGIDHPKHLKLLETLNIFAVRANYMTRFRDYLEREGVDTGGYLEMDLPLWTHQEFLEKPLYRPRIDNDQKFADECHVVLALDPDSKVRLDLTTKVCAYASAAAGGMHETNASVGHQGRLDPAVLDFIDWPQVSLELNEYKRSRNYQNLTIPRKLPREFFERKDPSMYDLAAPEEWRRPASREAADRLQEAVVSLLRKYMDRYYQQARQRWESETMRYEPLTVQDENFQPYRVSVPRSDPELVKTIFDIVKEAKFLSKKKKGEKLYAGEYHYELPNLHFDRHLYQPLLVARESKGKPTILCSPAPLNKGEERFLEDLKDFWQQEHSGSMKGKELYVLRNHGRSKGIGFFEHRGFYPDFILWIKDAQHQRILFVEPHGMMLEQGHLHSEKVGLHKKLKQHSKEALKKAKLNNVEVNAVVVSVTPYDELVKVSRKDDGTSYSREEFTAGRVLFQERSEDYDYIDLLLTD